MHIREIIVKKLANLLKGKVGILGYGIEGKSTLRFLQKFGISNLIVFDKKEQEAIDGVEFCCGEKYLSHLNQCDIVIRSAGISPLKKEILSYVRYGGKTSSQVELFFDLWKGDIVGVTGTLGKGSCVSMIEHILNKAGVPAFAAGNIGIPVLELIENYYCKGSADVWPILELSSFQLMNLKRSPTIAVALKSTSEHLDWHKDIEEYIEAKANLSRFQNSNDLCVYYGDVRGSRHISNCSMARKSVITHNQNFLEDICCVSKYGHLILLKDLLLEVWDIKKGQKLAELSIDDCAVNGDFQLENIGAAICVALEIGVSVENAISHVKSFIGLEYRMEKVEELSLINSNSKKVKLNFINDSYATRPDATIAAIKSLQNPSSLILGGSEKYADFSELMQTIEESQQLEVIAIIGNTAQRLKKDIKESKFSGEYKIFDTLDEAFVYCVEYILSKNVEDELCDNAKRSILLSPACASFGLFANYKERAKSFNRLVANFKDSLNV